VQEALTNVAKHADAASCRVYLHRLPHSLLVTVEDDGKGIAVTTPTTHEPARGVGLVSVRERVSRAGGTMNLESAPGRGTRLTVELPVPGATTTGHHGSSDMAAAVRAATET
jgi:signal transduction histidine kinase